MKVALISNRENSAVDGVMQDLKLGLAVVRSDWTVDLVRFEEHPKDELEEALSKYDVIHLGYAAYPINIEFECPVTANVWHILPNRWAHHRELFAQCGFSHFVVDDTGTLQALGQMGITDVTPIPMAFAPGRYPRLPKLDRPFTVGAFGEAFPTKRFDIVAKAARLIDAEAYLMTPPVGRSFFCLDPVEDVYSQIHVLVHCSFVDTNCRPALEALSCGIPVVSTLNQGLIRISNGGNVTFFDGSVKSLSRALEDIREKLDWHRESAAYTNFPSLYMVALKYVAMFETVVEGE